ncbi:MAG: hypothetical protein AAGK02_06625 [Pseudomonadota bacterium]
MNTPIDTLTKRDLNQKLASPLTEAQLKKTSKEALLARVKREATLRSRGRDRVLFDVQPDKMAMPREGTKRWKLIIALRDGADVERLQDLLGWNRDTVTSALYADVKACGFGVKREGGVLRLIEA